MGEQRAPDVAGREPGAPHRVTAVLVSHDGARWLPAVLDGLAAQSVRPDHVVAVDTGSKDESARLLAEALGADAVVKEKLNTGFPQAVRRGLEGLAACEWIWILHDDANPDPDALAALLDAAARRPRGRHSRPEAARVALAEPAPRGRRHDLGHGPSRDRPGAR